MNLKLLKQLIIILFGTTLTAFAVINFPVRYSLADSGFSGVNLIIYRRFGINVWISNLVLNAPFVFILFKMSDLKTVLITIYGVATLTGALAFWNFVGHFLPDWSSDTLLIVISYGILLGLGLGIVIKANGTTGGSVLVSKILYQKYHIPMSKTLFLFDLSVIILSLVAFLTLTNAVYTLIGIGISSIVVAKVQEGALFGYKVLIISENYELISHTIMNTLNRGATIIHATGAHSGSDKRILMVVIQKRELSQLKQLIQEVDPTSFVTVSHTYETIGQGFTYGVNLT